MSFKPATTAMSRVFMIEGRARSDHAPVYQSCMMAGTPSQEFGDLTRIECPDPNRPGRFIEMGTFRGATERGSVDLSSRYALEVRDELLRLARQGCPVDLHVHWGDCKDPSDFNGGWVKGFIVEDATLTNWSTSTDMGALGSGDQSEINSQTTISFRDMYEFVPLSFVSRAGDIITNELVDVIFADNISCGICFDESDGCQSIYAVTIAAGGSPGTPADVVLSLNKGTTWRAVDIDSLAADEAGDGIAHVGQYIVVVSNDSGSLHYADKDELDSTTTDEAWTEVSTGFVALGEPNDIWSVGNMAFIVGDGGYIYSMGDDPTSGVTVLDAGVAVSDNLVAVHALHNQFAVAVGNAGAIIKTTDGEQWQSVNRPVGVGVNLTCVWVKSKREWFVGASNGRMYITTDEGETWAEKGFPGSGAGAVRDIAFSTDNIGYLSHDTAAPRGRILRTINGGNSWYVMPEGVGSLPLNDRLNAIAACTNDPNVVVGVGLADDGADGFIVVGRD